jgi:hypothetical protein
VSGLESLPPDQRAVLQLILAQGRGYADLAATLRLDAAAVRERAHAGAAALAGGELDPATRGRVIDYLLGQQDDGERIVTYAELGGAPAACHWAQALRERLAAVARDELPELPAAAPLPTAVTNGKPAPPSPPPAPPRDPQPSDAGEPPGPRPSRLGGAILLAGALALAVVLAIVLIGGDDDGRSSASPATSGAQTQARARTQPSTTAQARAIGVAALRPPAGGSGLAAAIVQQYPGGRRLIAVQAERLPANSGQDFYAIWLQGTAGARFLGFVPNQVRANGGFLVSSRVPRGLDLSSYATVLVTTEDGSEGASTPTTPGATVLSGPLRLAG